jgi:hypothetical protein
VPRGVYVLRSADGGPEAVERFSCAAGATGWRYAATREPGGRVGSRVDLVVDTRWRQVRVELTGGGWTIRGGVTGRELLWVRSGAAEPVEHRATAVGFAAASPGLTVALARTLALSAGSSADLRVVAVDADTLATRDVPQRWQLVSVTEQATETRPLPVERYAVTDLETGETSPLYVAGDVVLDAPGVALEELDGPPTLG